VPQQPRRGHLYLTGLPSPQPQVSAPIWIGAGRDAQWITVLVNKRRGSLPSEGIAAGDLMIHHGDLPLSGECPSCRGGGTTRLCAHMAAIGLAFLGDQELTRRLAAVSRAELVTLITDRQITSPRRGIDLVPAGMIAGRGQNDRELAHLGERAMTSWWSWATGRNVASRAEPSGRHGGRASSKPAP
jgi:hypothetical protein